MKGTPTGKISYLRWQCNTRPCLQCQYFCINAVLKTCCVLCLMSSVTLHRWLHLEWSSKYFEFWISTPLLTCSACKMCKTSYKCAIANNVLKYMQKYKDVTKLLWNYLQHIMSPYYQYQLFTHCCSNILQK